MHDGPNNSSGQHPLLQCMEKCSKKHSSVFMGAPQMLQHLNHSPACHHLTQSLVSVLG